MSSPLVAPIQSPSPLPVIDHPLQFLGRQGRPSALGALLCLNSDSFTLPLLRKAWPSCNIHILADGAANRLYKWHMAALSDPSLPEPDRQEILSFFPDYIKGDLDSISIAASTYFKSRGSILLKDGDQDSNDFEKCVDLTLELLNSGPADVSAIYLFIFDFKFNVEEMKITFRIFVLQLIIYV